MAFSPLMRDKWTRIFRQLDSDNHGVLAREDIMNLTNRFMKKYLVSTTGKFADDIREAGLSIFDVVMNNRYGLDKHTVTLEEYLDMHQHFMDEKPEIFRNRFKKFYSAIFNVLDLNRDGYITFDQYKHYYQSFGRNEAIVETAFLALDKEGNGLISHEEFTSAYLDYLCNPNISSEQLPLY